MPIQPRMDAVEPLMQAVDGAVWVRYDFPHRLLFVGHERVDGWWVHSYDVVTGEAHDQPWPVEREQIVGMGYRQAFAVAVAERISRGY